MWVAQWWWWCSHILLRFFFLPDWEPTKKTTSFAKCATKSEGNPGSGDSTGDSTSTKEHKNQRGNENKEANVYLGICARSIIFASSLHKNTSALLFVCLAVVRMCFVLVISSFLPCRFFKYPIFNSLCKQFTYSLNSVHSIGLFVVVPHFDWFVFPLPTSSSFSRSCLRCERNGKNI